MSNATRHVARVDIADAAAWQTALSRGFAERLGCRRTRIEYVDRTRIEHWLVDSASRPDHLYRVLVSSDGTTPTTASCDCPATRICKHQSLAVYRAGLFTFTISPDPVPVVEHTDHYPPRAGWACDVGPVLFPKGTRVEIAVGLDKGRIGVVSLDRLATMRRVEDPLRREVIGMYAVDHLRLAPEMVDERPAPVASFLLAGERRAVAR
jgi:hypothetical protein